MSATVRMAFWLGAFVVASPCFAAEQDWSKVDEALGKSGTVQGGGVYRVAFPRSDLKVSLDGVAIKPGLSRRSAGGSPSNRWAATRWSWAIWS